MRKALTILLCCALPSFATNVTVNMTAGFQFDPRNLAIEVGDRVIWTNLDSALHNSISGTNPVPSGLWASALFPRGGSFSFSFTNVAPGDYAYYCSLHAANFGMIGSVTVRPPNLLPSVTITNPADGTVFPAGTTALIEADARDSDGAITSVQFLANSNVLGVVQAPPFAISLAPPPGTYALQAVALDNRGGATTSAVVHVTFNLSPAITITNPVNNRAFFVGTNILVEADASDPDGTLSQVDFLVNGTSAAAVVSPPYAFVFSNAALGDYVLTAVATDNLGATSSSPAVAISVITPPERPTILIPPLSQTAIIGSNVSFTVSAAGTAPLAYQWRANGANLAGATTDSLLLTTVTTNDSGSYAVVVTNVAGAVTSAPAILLVTLPPDIPPNVTITNPAGGTRFPAHANVTISAEAHDPDGAVVRVEFFVTTNLFNTNSIGVVTNPPYTMVLTNLSAGRHVATAQATDDRDGASTSAPVTFTVHAPPIVALTRAPDSPALPLGTNLNLTAVVGSSGTSITNVEFVEGVTSLGRIATPPFTLNWTPAEPRIYSLTAVATDDLGQIATSVPISVRIFTPEGERPTLKITLSPRNFARLAAARVSIAGVAADNVGLDRVEYQLNDGPRNVAQGLTAWSFETNLLAGKNALRVRSIDLAGNASFEATRFFTFAAHDRLTVIVHGTGAARPELNGRLLEIGKTYRLTARPDPGQIFASWGGVPNSNHAALNFVMRSNLTLVLNLASNPFPAAAGTYTGLFSDTNTPTLENSGSIKLRLGGLGSFSGKLGMDGGNYSFRGKFDVSGAARVSVLRRALSPLAMDLQLDLAGSSGRLDGFVTGSTTGKLWTANLSAQLNRSTPGPSPAPYSFVVATSRTEGNPMIGEGVATVRETGEVQFRGRLANGPKFALSSGLGKEGAGPFYLPLNRRDGVILGWVYFDGASDPRLNGQLLLLAPDTNRPSVLGIQQHEPWAARDDHDSTYEKSLAQ